MRFTVPALITVEVTDLDALLVAAAQSASTRHRAPSEPRLILTGTDTETAATALTELAYPPAIIDGHPGITITDFTLDVVLQHVDV